MTENLLVKALAAHLADVLADFRLDSPQGSERAVTVVEGYLPPKRSSDGGDFPFCIVRPVAGAIGSVRTSCDVDILVGAYCDESEGYQYALNLLRRAAMGLMALPGRVLAGRYVFSGEMTWELDDDQPYPAWTAVLHTKWSFVSPAVIPAADPLPAADDESVTITKEA